MEIISILLHRLVVMRAMIDWYRAIHFAQLSELYSVITYGHGDHSAGSTAMATARAISGQEFSAASITIRVFSITFLADCKLHILGFKTLI
jgi:hypothetical protein